MTRHCKICGKEIDSLLINGQRSRHSSHDFEKCYEEMIYERRKKQTSSAARQEVDQD